MNGLPQNDLYYESPPNRSPRVGNYQTQSLNRQSSRPLGGFDPQSQLYGMEDMASRFQPNMQNSYPVYDTTLPQAWNSSAFAQNSSNNSSNFAGINATNRRASGRPGRSGLPNMWMDHHQSMGPQGGFAPFGGPNVGMPASRHDVMPQHPEEEELIPTAIVIKNIPFAVKKEQLMDVMSNMGLPLPYAFNYHFDNGVFRGLAFANFTSADETQHVIQAMNHMDLNGRKLRVEYKKMLPQAERDRIEREKRERRGQLEEQHRPVPPSSLHPQSSLGSLVQGVQARSPSPGSVSNNTIKLDMNDPVTLNFYSELLVFQSNPEQGEMKAFPPHLPPPHRRIVHGLAHNLNLGHASEGSGSDRHIRVFRNPAQGQGPGVSANVPNLHNSLDPQRRGLYRAATTDFSDVRDPNFYGPSRQGSGYLGFPEPSGSLSAGGNLRTAKSHADLRSYTPSPAQSAASFPAGLRTNIAQYSEYNQGQSSPVSTRPTVTPTTSSMQSSNETILMNGLGNLSMSSNAYGGSGGSPHRLRGMLSWEREGPAPGPIGGHRAFSANHDESNRSRNATGPTRQPRGPTLERGAGFTRGRQNGHASRNSDELSSHNDVDALIE